MFDKLAPKSESDKEIEDLAETLRNVSQCLGKLISSGLNRKAVIVLVQDATGVPKKTISKVLDSLEDLSKKYTSKK